MNDVLQRFHRYALGRVVWPLSLIVGLIFAFGWSLALDSIFNKFLGPLTSAATVGGAFWFFERWIRLHFWKVVYPEYDFKGKWKGYTEYCKPEGIPEDAKLKFEPFKKRHDIRFKQDCLSVMVDYDETDAYQGWNSTIATLFKEKGKIGLRYAYEVTYRQGETSDERLPDNSKGLEEISVVGSEEGKIPMRVTGVFAHTTDGPAPRYSGTVAFDRVLEESSKEPNWVSKLIVKYLRPPAE